MVRRLGGTRPEPADTWVLSATSVDLAAAARAGRFREDLYHRLALVPLSLPPLRARRADVLPLAAHFLRTTCADYGLPLHTLAPSGQAALLAHDWPGNIRELANVVERAVLLTESLALSAEDLGLTPRPPGPAPASREPADPVDLAGAVARLEREQLRAALERTRGNVTRAAAELGLTRDQVRYRLAKYAGRPGRRPRRRRPGPPAEAAPVDAPAGLPAADPPTVAWELRRLALLRVQHGDAEPSERRLPASVVDKVRSFGGRIEDLSPTDLVAVFGLEPVEDAPRRAAFAGLAVRRALEQPGAAHAAVRIAVHVGEVLVGGATQALQIAFEAKRALWATLDAMMAGIDPGMLVLSDTAVPFLSRRFALTALDPIAGVPGRVHRLVGPEPSGPVGPRGTPFVGRDPERALLQQRVAAARHGHVLAIIGDAGIGKSRLLAEFRQTLAGSAVQVLAGDCQDAGTATPFLQLLQVLRQHLGLDATAAPAMVHEKIACGLEALELSPAEGTPLLLRLLGIAEGTERLATLSPEAIRLRTFELLRGMCYRWSMRPQGSPAELERRRRRAMRLLDGGLTRSAVARMVGAAVSAVWQWRETLRRRGPEGLAAKPALGRPRKLTPRQRQRASGEEAGTAPVR